MNKWVKAILQVAPLLAVLLTTLLQHTVGEAGLLTYVAMSLPPCVWTALLLLFSAFFLFRRHWGLAIGYGVGCVLSILFLWDPSTGSPDPTIKANLRVMTFNIEKFRAFKPDQVAAVIKKANPDIVCLQEVAPLDEPWLIPKSFHQALPGYQIIQRGETAIASKYPVSFGAVFALRGGSGGRPAQMVTIMVGRQPVSVICLHMQYFPWDGSLGVSQASKNLMKEISSLEDLVRDPGIPTIVAGDFNTVPHGRTHRMLRKYLKDCYADANKGFGFTLPAASPLRRLDYIYAGRGLKPVRTWVDKNVASDHRAVVADLRLGNSSPPPFRGHRFLELSKCGGNGGGVGGGGSGNLASDRKDL